MVNFGLIIIINFGLISRVNFGLIIHISFGLISLVGLAEPYLLATKAMANDERLSH